MVPVGIVLRGGRRRSSHAKRVELTAKASFKPAAAVLAAKTLTLAP